MPVYRDGEHRVTRQTGDGATVMVRNHRTVASDSADRIFQERRRFVPADSNSPSLVFQLEFSESRPHMQGTQAFTVSDVRLAQPDARLSVLPTCYKVLDQRDAYASSRQVTARSSIPR